MQHFVALQVAKIGCYTCNFFRNLRCKLQEKLRRVTWPLGGHSNLSVRDHWARTGHFDCIHSTSDCIHSNAVLVFQHIITPRVTKSTAGIRRVAKLDFISATTVATVARFYHTKREKKPIHTVLGPSFLNLTISHLFNRKQTFTVTGCFRFTTIAIT